MSFRAKGWLVVLTFSLSAWAAFGLVLSHALQTPDAVLISSNEAPASF